MITIEIFYINHLVKRDIDFKLYRMIAKSVHNHIPKQQIEKEIFLEYKTIRKSINKKAQNNVLNIDKMNPQY